MTKDQECAARTQRLLDEAGLDALVCTLPANVLLLTGYWPVVGTALAIAVRGGPTLLLAPADEQDLAEASGADEVHRYHPGSLEEITSPAEAIRQPLQQLARRLQSRGLLGYESGAFTEPASYAAMYLFGGALRPLLEDVFPSCALTSADASLHRVRAHKTSGERTLIGIACAIAGRAFDKLQRELRPGLFEAEIAHRLEGPLAREALRIAGVRRAGGFAFCMSGPNAAKAGAAYARTRDRRIEPGDAVLVHCNSYIDGFWTDITRTYCLIDEADRQTKILHELLEARAAALAEIRPGVAASVVDQRARAVLAAQGHGKEFTHGLGHGVGFAAIDADARPRLHPASPDVLEEGMVFNVEPAVYLPGIGGWRHCDVVSVTAKGADVLSPFQSQVHQLVCGSEWRASA